LLAAVLAQVSSGEAPRLEQILFDVPIAGLSGTLVDRFDTDDTAPARGLVRGKTGYLGGAATLAGVAVMPDGRTVGYSIVVHGFDGADADDAELPSTPSPPNSRRTRDGRPPSRDRPRPHRREGRADLPARGAGR